MTNNDFQAAVDLINKSNNILITSHIRPDGDACGSIEALSDALTALGKKTKTVMLSQIPQWYEFLFDRIPPIIGSDITIEQLKETANGQIDLVIIADTNSYIQLPQFDEYLKQNHKPILVIDHHITSDSIGNVELIDTTAAATGLIVFDLLKYAGWPITEKIARSLFVAAATDTGWFQFNNTDSRVHRVCAELIDCGVSPPQIYHELYENYSYARFKLMTAMFNSLELHLDGRFATQFLRQKDFEQTGALYNDTENLIDECRRIGTVRAVALFVELDDGRVKCSLRSKGEINVCKIANKFNGGGHKMAAGTRIAGPVENAKQLILDEVAKQFAKNAK